MNPLPPLNDFLNTPDFWMLLLCDEFMGEDRFREFLESIPLMGRAMQMGQGKNPDEMKAIVRNLARQKGWSDEQLGQFLSPFGLKL